MNETTTTTDPLLDTLRARESALNAEMGDEMRAHAVVVAKLMGRIEEVRDLIGAITRKKPGRKPKVAEVADEPAGPPMPLADLAGEHS